MAAVHSACFHRETSTINRSSHVSRTRWADARKREKPFTWNRQRLGHRNVIGSAFDLCTVQVHTSQAENMSQHASIVHSFWYLAIIYVRLHLFVTRNVIDSRLGHSKCISSRYIVIVYDLHIIAKWVDIHWNWNGATQNQLIFWYYHWAGNVLRWLMTLSS